jgi:hypothetical protein
MSANQLSNSSGKIYGYGASTGYATAKGNYSTVANSTQINQSCMSCFDTREPSMTTILYGDSRRGFLPAGSYNFTQEGAVVDVNNGFPLSKDSLFAQCSGPIYGATMGSCVPRSVQSKVLNQSGGFNPIPSSQSRGCYI